MRMIRVGLLLCLASILAFAQLGGLLKKKNGGNAGGADPAVAMTQAQDLLGYVTIATDNGVKGVEALATVFPPEKVQKIADLAVKYNEMKTKRGDQNIDAESLQVASDIAEEMAKLDADWQSHVKEKSAAVKKADARLALVILADTLAGTKAPETAKALQSVAQDLKSDPTQASKMNRMLAMASVLTAVGKEAPKQAASFKTVRGITKRIAEAEKVQLTADPSPDQVKDKSSLTTSSKSCD